MTNNNERLTTEQIESIRKRVESVTDGTASVTGKISREDVPKLLAEIEILCKRIDDLEDSITSYVPQHFDTYDLAMEEYPYDARTT